MTRGERRPLAFMLNGGQVVGRTAGAALLEHPPDCSMLHADKGPSSRGANGQKHTDGLQADPRCRRAIALLQCAVAVRLRPSREILARLADQLLPKLPKLASANIIVAVKRWRNAGMALRWIAAGMIDANKGLR